MEIEEIKTRWATASTYVRNGGSGIAACGSQLTANQIRWNSLLMLPLINKKTGTSAFKKIFYCENTKYRKMQKKGGSCGEKGGLSSVRVASGPRRWCRWVSFPSFEVSPR
jgi:hypothetical protein